MTESNEEDQNKEPIYNLYPCAILVTGAKSAPATKITEHCLYRALRAVSKLEKKSTNDKEALDLLEKVRDELDNIFCQLDGWDCCKEHRLHNPPPEEKTS